MRIHRGRMGMMEVLGGKGLGDGVLVYLVVQGDIDDAANREGDVSFVQWSMALYQE